MKVQDKEQSVADLREKLGRASVAVLAVPRGLTVAQVTALRRKMRDISGEYKIAKNTLAIRAVEDTDFGSLKDLLEGPTALVFGYGDPFSVIKEMVTYSGDNAQKLEIKAAVLDGQVYGPAQVGEIAKLGNRDMLRAQLLGVLQAPASQLVRLLNEPGASFARVLAARGTAGAPADA